MKTTSIIASVLFGSMAAAAPMLNKRAYMTKTSTVIQTEIAYTTIYADEVPTAASGAFFEQGKKTTAPAAPAAPTNKPVESVAPVQPSSVSEKKIPVAEPTKPAAAPATTQAPVKPTTTQAPVQPTTQAPPPAPKPTTSQAPAPVSSAPVAAPSASSVPSTPSAPSTGGGQTFDAGSMTIHPFNGALGACGSAIQNTDYKVALDAATYGTSTWDRMTGESTNKWCGQKIKMSYKGKSVTATIMDKCPGCTNGGLDVTSTIWKELTGLDEGDRLQGMTWTAI